MKSLYRTKDRTLQFVEIEEPYIRQPDDIKIRVRYNTICSDELRMNQEGEALDKEGVLGHEMSGEIVDLGEMAKMQGFQVGDYVAGDPILACGQCLACKRRQENYCSDLQFITGTMCKYIIRSSKQLVKLPKSVSLREGCLLEPIAAVLGAIENAGISFGKSVMILGAGFSGLMFAQIAKMKGASSVTVVEQMKGRRDTAKKRGADYVLDYQEEYVYTKMCEITDFNGFDIVVETTADPEMMNSCVKLIARGGTMLFYTYYGAMEKISINTMNMYLENLHICFSFSSHGKLDEALRLIPLLKVDELISAEFEFDQGIEAYEYQMTKQSIKTAIRI